MTAEEPNETATDGSCGCDGCSPGSTAASSAVDLGGPGGADDGGGAGDGERLRLSVPGMDCPSCAGKVERAVSGLDGVSEVDPRPTTGTLHVRYDSDGTTSEAVRDRVEAAGYDVETGETVSLSVPEMDCPSCAGKVERALAGTDGVLEFDTRPTAGAVVATFDPDRTSRGGVVAAVEGAGYEVLDDDEAGSPHDVWRSPRALKTWAGAGFLLFGLGVRALAPSNPTLLSVAGVPVTASLAAFLAATVVAGEPVFRDGYYSLRNRSLDIDLLMTIGATGALLAGLPFDAATLAVLFSIAELLERFSMDRARDSMRQLMELSPDTATVRREGEERVVPAEAVEVGETVVVRPGEKVPLDGVVREGRSAVDESPITGESVPVDVEPGEEVYAGSVLEEGFLAVEVTAPASESTLARVIELVEDAQRNRTESERFVDRFAGYYTPVIVVGALLTAFVPPLALGAPFDRWFVRGLTLLVVACPCAFVISTPVTVVSAITSAARNGVLLKGGDRLEALGEIDVVAFDKTGTLTTGELGITDVVPLGGRSESELLSRAAALESRSEHPIAEAIVSFAAEEDGGPTRTSGDDRGGEYDVSSFESLPGEGVRADLDGRTYYAGKPGLFADLGFDLEHAHVATDGGRLAGGTADRPAESDGAAADADLAVDATACDHGAYVDLAGDVVPRLQSEGKSVVLVGTETELVGVLAVADTLRPEAEWAVSRLAESGVRTAMLTGDNARTARVIGDRVGVDEVRADLLPEEKVAAIERLAGDGGAVAMVGDGVNDAPALATATVGVAMGAAGTDSAIETADVALLSDDLTRLPYLIDLSRKARGTIRQNVWGSLAVKAILAVGAPLGLVSVLVAIVVGDMGMSLTVTGNAMRLANESPDHPEFE
ncbi:MAG: heavy metal translocating P-type ATPase, partial [Salinigranum sp.]